MSLNSSELEQSIWTDVGMFVKVTRVILALHTQKMRQSLKTKIRSGLRPDLIIYFLFLSTTGIRPHFLLSNDLESRSRPVWTGVWTGLRLRLGGALLKVLLLGLVPLL